MSKLLRYAQKLFGTSAGTNQMSEFGSLAAGTPARFSGATITPDLVQALGNYVSGWNAAVVGSGNPTIEDMNALCYLFGYQLSYLMQQGVPEWNSTTTYYIGSVVNDGSGNLYVSLTNTNLNNALTSATNWKITTFGRAVSSSGTVPLGGVGLTASSGTWVGTSNNAGYDAVTNQSVTIVTTGKPVIVNVQASGSTLGNGNWSRSSANLALFKWQRNGSDTFLSSIQPATSNTGYPAQSVGSFIDTSAPSGTNVYTFYASPNGSGTVGITNMCSVIFEMN